MKENKLSPQEYFDIVKEKKHQVSDEQLRTVEMFKDYPDVLTPGDLQKILRIGRNSTYKLLSENQIETIRLGKKYIIPKVNVIKYLTTTT